MAGPGREGGAPARDQAPGPEKNAILGEGGRESQQRGKWGPAPPQSRRNEERAGASQIEGKDLESGPHTGTWESRPKRAAREGLGPGRNAQSLTAAVARLCMLGAAAALLPLPDASQPRPRFSGSAAKDEEPRQPPSASGSLRPLRSPMTFHP